MKILMISFYDLIKFSRNKVVLAILIVLPIMFSILTGSIYNQADNSNGTIKKQVGIENLDNGNYGSELIDELKKNETIKLNVYDINEDIYSDIQNLDIEIGFIIPKNFSEKISDSKEPIIETIKTPNTVDSKAIENIISNEYNNLFIMDNLNNYFYKKILTDVENIEFKEDILKELDENYTKNTREKLVKVSSNWYEGDNKSNDYDGASQSTIGYIIMFVMFTVILGTGEILEEKKFNTWERLKITPTSKISIYLGKNLGVFLRGVFQIIILILFGYFVLGVPWGNSIFATIIVLITFLLCITSLGIFIATLVKTNSQLGALTTIVIVPSTALSGCWWPLFIEPEPMQKLAVIFPQYWTLEALTNTVVGNLGIDSIKNSVFVLLGMTVIFFILALVSESLQSGIHNKFKFLKKTV
jgi:ABC-2 type transport system permease protein